MSKTPRLKPLDKKLGAALRKARIDAGISQQRLGRRVGLTFQQVQKYEGGKNRIAVSTLYRLAPVLGYTARGFLAMFDARRGR